MGTWAPSKSVLSPVNQHKCREGAGKEPLCAAGGARAGAATVGSSAEVPQIRNGAAFCPRPPLGDYGQGKGTAIGEGVPGLRSRALPAAAPPRLRLLPRASRGACCWRGRCQTPAGALRPPVRGPASVLCPPEGSGQGSLRCLSLNVP